MWQTSGHAADFPACSFSRENSTTPDPLSDHDVARGAMPLTNPAPPHPKGAEHRRPVYNQGMADAIQTAFTLGMPALAVLVGTAANKSRLGDLRGYVGHRFDALEQILNARFAEQKAELRALTAPGRGSLTPWQTLRRQSLAGGMPALAVLAGVLVNNPREWPEGPQSVHV